MSKPELSCTKTHENTEVETHPPTEMQTPHGQLQPDIYIYIYVHPKLQPVWSNLQMVASFYQVMR